MAEKEKTLENKEPSIFFFHLQDTNAIRVTERTRKNKPYVFFGEDNLFPQRLVDLSDNSSIHESLLESTANMVAGQGFIFEGDQATQAEAMYEGWLGERLDSAFRNQLAVDVSFFNGFYVQTLYNRDGKIDTVKHKDFSTVRAGKQSLNTRKIEEFWISSDWKFATRRNNFTAETEIFRPFQIPTFNPSKFKDIESKEFGQLLQVKKYKPTKFYYAEPVYLGALDWIEIDAQIGALHKNNLKNGMVSSFHIHLNEDLSDKAKRKEVEKGIQEKFTGTENVGSVVLTWSTNKELVPKITSLPNNNTHEMYTMLSDKTNAQIVTAHRFLPIIAGINVKTGLDGQAPAIRESLELVINTVIKPKQEMINQMMDSLFKVNDLKVETKIKQLDVISLFSEFKNLIESALTIDEQRALVNHEPLEQGQVVVGTRPTANTPE